MSIGNSPIPPAVNATPFWPADNPAVMSHMTLIQGIINRLAANSASCKAWCIALVTALVSLTGATRIPGIIGIALVPVVIFGFLDSSYLAQERAYRDLFNTMAGRVRDRTYTMTDIFVTRVALTARARMSAFISWSVFPMYAALLVLGALAYWMGWLDLLAAVANAPRK